MKAPETKRLKLRYGELLSSCAFNFKLRRYILFSRVLLLAAALGAGAVALAHAVTAVVDKLQKDLDAEQDLDSDADTEHEEVSRGRHCSPRHRHTFEPSFLKVTRHHMMW